MAQYNTTTRIQQPWQIALTCYWLAMFIGTHIPETMPHMTGGTADKLVHFSAFAGLAVLFAINWQLSGGHLTLRHFLVVWFVLVAYGAFDELLQIPVGRVASVYDWMADAAGAAAGLWAFQRWRPWILVRLRGH